MAPPGVTLDSGVLLALQKRDRTAATFIRRSIDRKVALTVPTIVIAQTWRGSNPILATLLKSGVPATDNNYDFISQIDGQTNTLNIELPELVAAGLPAEPRSTRGSAKLRMVNTRSER